MPDALHFACAPFHGGAALWTQAERLAGVSGGLAKSVVGDQAKPWSLTDRIFGLGRPNPPATACLPNVANAPIAC